MTQDTRARDHGRRRSRPTLREHHPHAVHGRRAAGQLRPSGHADGDGARRLRALAAPPPLRSRPTRSGPTATASCSRWATPRCCSTRCCTSPACKAVNPKYETLGAALGDAGRHQALPPARQPLPGPPGVSLDLGRRDHHGAARPGRGHQRGHGDRLASGWPRTSTGPASRCSASTSTRSAGDGCMMEGISGEAASLAGHLQLDNLCWIYDNNRITIEGHTKLAFSEDVATRFIGYGWNVTRVGDANDLAMLDRAFDTFKSHDGPADPDHRGQPHRLRRSHQAGHPRRPRRAARRRGDQARQAVLRLAGGREVPRPGGRARAFRPGIGARGAKLRERVDVALRGATRRRIPPKPTRCTACSTASSPRAGTRSIPTFPADAKGARRARRVRQGAERGRPKHPLAHRRLRRPHALHQDAAHVRGRRRFRGRELRRPQLPLRHPRARDGRGPERAEPLQGAALRLRLPHLQRLRAARDPAGRDHGDPGHLRLHPRLDRRGRGRTDAPAGRAPAVAARDSGPGDDPARRRQRGGGGLARDPGIPPPSRPHSS